MHSADRAFIAETTAKMLLEVKAVLFFQALRKQIGEEAFDRFLHAHYSQHRYGYISGADLLHFLEKRGNPRTTQAWELCTYRPIEEIGRASCRERV